MDRALYCGRTGLVSILGSSWILVYCRKPNIRLEYTVYFACEKSRGFRHQEFGQTNRCSVEKRSDGSLDDRAGSASG
jgi:hypothetical protein